MPASHSYHITRQGEPLGEMSLPEIQSALEAGSLLPEDLAWQEGMEDWQPLGILAGQAAAGSGAAASAAPRSQVQIKAPRQMQLSQVQEGSSKGRSNLGPGLLTLDTQSSFAAPKSAKTGPLLSGASLPAKAPAEPGFVPHPPQRTVIGGKPPAPPAKTKTSAAAVEPGPQEPEVMPWAPQPMRKPQKPVRAKGSSGILRLLLLTVVLLGILYGVYYKYYGFRISIEAPPPAAESKSKR